MATLVTRADLRILDFDIENRPLSYLGSDYTTGEITAIGAAWVPAPGKRIRVRTWVLTPDPISAVDLLLEFRDLYDAADIVTGHYIRGYDLPVLNGAYLEYGLPPLGPKLTQDTKLDLNKAKYQSLSQENLAAMLGVPAKKVHMTQDDWREANRLTPVGIEKTRRRVASDVRQHVLLRRELLDLGWLQPPKRWDGTTRAGGYRP